MKNVTWTEWAKARLLPFPGDAWKVEGSLKKAEAKVKGVPAKPDLADEIKRGVKLGVNELYDPKGNRAKDSNGANLVDIWVARAGVVFATEALIGVCRQPTNPRAATPGAALTYKLRHDGQPWARLREHLAAASPADRAAAQKLAAGARKDKSDVRQAVAYAFCEPAWVLEDLDKAIKNGYGQLAILAALPDAKTAKRALQGVLDPTIPKYQAVEELFPHMPNLMVRLDDKDADLVTEAANRAWNAKVRKPWDEIVACLPKA